MAQLTIQNVSKRFGDVTALSGVDLQVNDGEFCVLVGPSGCGKSTLLQVVAGLTKQDEGGVYLNGRLVNRLSPRERDVAMVFQNYALYPHMTVAENLGFGLRMRRVPREMQRKKIAETAELLGIEQLLDRKPRQLSGGQRQRVAMGRALVRNPKIFLLDEPLSNLDAQLRISVRLELKRLHAAMKSTVLYVTHDQVEAMTLGDRVAVIKDGRLHQVDRPEAVYDRPADTFVATFIGSPVMNLLPGHVIREADRYWFRSQDIALELGGVAPDLQGSRVEAGIRPEDLMVTQDPAVHWKARVDMRSDVGAHSYLHVRTGKTDLTIRVAKGTPYRPGDIIGVDLDVSKVHLFQGDRRVQWSRYSD
jgi:multiple sugar transport system ATP-binding protein